MFLFSCSVFSLQGKCKTVRIFYDIIRKNLTSPPPIKYKLIYAFTNQVTLQNKLLYIIADSDDGM